VGVTKIPLCYRELKQLWVLMRCTREDPIIAFGASDAAGEGNEPLAGTIYSQDLNNTTDMRWALPEGLKGAHIARQELEAFILTATTMRARFANANTLIIATDSLNVLYWVEKMYASCGSGVNEQLYRLYEKNYGINIVPVYVLSEKNVADWPSRNAVGRERDAQAQEAVIATRTILKGTRDILRLHGLTGFAQELGKTNREEAMA
jgi:hypothetical protein